MEAVLEQGEPLRFESIAGISKTLAEEYAGSLPTVFVNPLPDQDLSLSVSPGRILVDVTHASSDDLAALATLLSDVQARLDYRKMRGRPPELNEEQMTFVHDLRTTPTGRAKLRSWHTVVRLFNARFTQDISETTLKQRYRRWTQATGVDTKIAQH
jgi:hypothetical protein